MSWQVKRNNLFTRPSPVAVLVSLLVIGSEPIYAYIGPGAGLTLLGSLIAVAAVVLVTVLGLILYPIRLIRKFIERKQRKE